MTQWHPIFAQLLRPAVEGYYETEAFLVGDAPREADFVLLRRTSTTPAPFHGLWRNLTTWNVLEYKGPTVSPRRGHLESLVEVGLGVDRQLRTRRDAGRRGLAAAEMSFWYLANHLGQRFLRPGSLAVVAHGVPRDWTTWPACRGPGLKSWAIRTPSLRDEDRQPDTNTGIHIRWTYLPALVLARIRTVAAHGGGRSDRILAPLGASACYLPLNNAARRVGA